MTPFSVSVVIPVLDEEQSLRTTIDALLADNASDIHELLVVVCSRTSTAVRRLLDTVQSQHPGRIIVLEQALPGLGGALRRGIDAASGTHVITMYSDLESDPASVADLTEVARQSPGAVINASRWLKGSAFDGYGPLKLILNRAFQRTFATLFRTAVTDFTFGYRLYPATVVKAIAFTETGHSFVFESILQVIMRGGVIVEIPTRWTKRREGFSQVTLLTYAPYWILGLTTWLRWMCGLR